MTKMTQCLIHTASTSSEEQRAIITQDDSCSSIQPTDSCSSSIQPDDSIEFLSSQVTSLTELLIGILINFSWRNI
jgi:hypothetical protein